VPTSVWDESGSKKDPDREGNILSGENLRGNSILLNREGEKGGGSEKGGHLARVFCEKRQHS